MENFNSRIFSIFCQHSQKFCFATNSSLIGEISQVLSKFTKFPVLIVSGGKYEAFCISRDHRVGESRDLIWEILSPEITKVMVKAAELNNKNLYVLQIGTTLFYYKLGQTLLQIGAASLIQIWVGVVTNWGSYYKLGQHILG